MAFFEPIEGLLDIYQDKLLVLFYIKKTASKNLRFLEPIEGLEPTTC